MTKVPKSIQLKFEVHDKIFYYLLKIYISIITFLEPQRRQGEINIKLFCCIKIIQNSLKVSWIKSSQEQITVFVFYFTVYTSLWTRFHYFPHLSDEETKVYNMKVTFPTITNLIKGQTMPGLLASNPIYLSLN